MNSLSDPPLEGKEVSRHIRTLILALLLVASAAGSTFAVIRAIGASPQKAAIRPSQPLGPATAVTLANPLVAGARQMSQTAAATAFGGPLTLPDSPIAGDAGAVWEVDTGDSGRDRSVAVAITFPSDGLIIRYEKPTLPDPESAFQNMTKDMPGSRVVYLNGGSLPALSIPQVESDWGSITFVSGAATIVVMGHNDEATLERVAQSILDRSAA